jgi:maleate isomerase
MNKIDKQPLIKRFSYRKDKGIGERARIGLLVLESDQTIEEEFRQLTRLPGVAVYHARLKNNVIVTPETLMEMEMELPLAAQLLPNYLGLNSIGYGCTSASTIIGEDKISNIIEEFHPNTPSSNPLTAAKVALKKLGVKRVALVTPYTPDVTQALQDKFLEARLPVTVVGSYFEKNDLNVGLIDKQSILETTISVGQSEECDGVFISCTTLRATKIIEEAELRLKKPVTGSNHALAWHLLRLAGIKDKISGLGQLFSTF